MPTTQDRRAAKSLHNLALGVAALDHLLDGHRAEGQSKAHLIAARAFQRGVADLLRKLSGALERRRSIGPLAEVTQH